MRVSQTALTGSQGQQAVGGQFLALNWGATPIPQEQDFTATDLWLSARDVRRFDLGALVGAQVKSGPSWFSSPEREAAEIVGWWHSDTKDHFESWSTHRVPHILVLHDPATGVSYWVHVTADKVVDTGERSKILVPSSSTVDEDHVDQLLEVANTDLGHPGWEGSSWNRRDILRRDRLRYALLTPRLIAPHPNLLVEQFEPEEAIAVLIEMRLGGLEPSPFPWEVAKTPALEDCRASDNWWWRFYAALYDVLVDVHDVSEITALISSEGIEPFEQAAAAATAAAMLVERGRPADGLEVVIPLIEADDCEPVDHNWLLMHKARCLSDLGDLKAAQDLAIEIQTLRPIARTDPTAGALVGSSAGLIVATSWSEPHAIADVLEGRDTLAGWWRTEEVAQGLQHQVEEDFRKWAKDTAVTIGASDQTWLRLRAASLIAGLTGDHTAWRSAHAQLARRVLITGHHSTARVVWALTAMRIAGDNDGVELAVRHLLRVGPAIAVKDGAGGIDLDNPTRTGLLADIEFIGGAADVLDTADADRHAEWALRVLGDLSIVTQRLKPTFVVPIYVLRMLTELTSALSEAGLRAVIDHLTGLPAQQDQAAAHGYMTVMSRIPASSWTTDDITKLGARQGDNFELAGQIAAVLARAEPETRAGLLAKINEGDLSALAAYGDIGDLPAETVEALIAQLGEGIRQQIAQLRSGQSALRSIEPADALARINAQRPEHSDWEPVLDLLRTESPFTGHLERVLRTLRLIGPRVRDDAADRLQPVLHHLMTSRPAVLFPDHRDVRGLAAGALASIRPNAISDPELWELLSGDADQRAASALVVTSRRRPEQLDVLASLAFDGDPKVRATAANCVAYWFTHDVAADPSLALLIRILEDPGTEVARAVASLINGSDTTDAVRQLASLIRNHPSAYVRSVAAQHL